jgi:hypothetical protein
VRPRSIALIALAVVAFLAVTFELARFLTAAGGERDDVYDLLVDQARGDSGAMLARLDGCAADPSCRRLVVANARRLRTAGRPKILSYESDTAYALSTKTAPARVAWAVVARDSPAVVQCVTVHRRWSFVSGATVSLRRVSAPIDAEAGC